MKHSFLTIIYLMLLFVGSQFIGLFINDYYSRHSVPYDIQVTPMSEGFNIAYLIGGISVMSLIFFLFMKLKYERFLRLWFSIALIISLSISLSVFIGEVMALIIAVILTIIRLNNKDVYFHNFTELFVYGGIVAIFAPLFTPVSVIFLLIIISVYDYVSVFVTKHMITMAKSQSAINLFNGLMITHKGDGAMLGGGDIAFALLFSAIISRFYGFIEAFFSTYLITASLFALMILGRKGKFYPAMPFVTGACIISYLLIVII